MYTSFHDLKSIIDLFSINNDIICTNILQNIEAKEYNGYSFLLNNNNVIFRSAKITPKKISHFVTIWKRNENQITVPFDSSDNIDYFIITVRKDNNFGCFIFPVSTLLEHNIISNNEQGGKRGIRIYSPWDITINKQAKITQQWQIKYFLDMSQNKIIDMNKFNRLQKGFYKSNILMDQLLECKNYKPSITKNIIIHGKSYPVNIQGSGNIAAVCIGGATLMQRTLSSKFKHLVTFYSCDLYWPKKFRTENPTDITIEKIISDMFEVINQLKLDSVILFGHSAYGIMALEAAKTADKRIKAVIMVGTPTESNNEVAEKNNLYFKKYASKERQENDRLRRENYEKIRKPIDSEISLNSYESFSARYWYDYNITRQFLEELWQDVEIDDAICNHFFCNLLPNHITANNIDKIKVPVILLAGKFDYDCLPLNLWKNYPQPKNFTIIDCENTGHWPNIENSEAFDREVEKWLKKINLIK